MSGDTDELKRRAVDWETELKAINATLETLLADRQQRDQEIGEIRSAVESHARDMNQFKNQTQLKFNEMGEDIDELKGCLEGANGEGMAGSVDRLVKLIDGDPQYSITGIRDHVKAIVKGQDSNSRKIDDLKTTWTNTLKWGRWVIGAFLFGFGINIVFGFYILWTLVQHDAGVVPPGLP